MAFAWTVFGDHDLHGYNIDNLPGRGIGNKQGLWAYTSENSPYTTDKGWGS